MLGGLSWESTALYYTLLNQGIKDKLGGLHSAKINLQSLDFFEIEKHQRQDNWPIIAQQLIQAAKSVEAAGADFLMLCNNTLHKLAPEIEQVINIPLLHIADVTGAKIVQDGLCRVGLLGTRQTMESGFYANLLKQIHKITVITPNQVDRQLVHDIIFTELCLGQIKQTSRDKLLGMIERLKQQGAQAIILGCTELPLLIAQNDTSVPLYDTTKLHAQAAIELATSKPNNN